jgi:hypothetical protein
MAQHFMICPHCRADKWMDPSSYAEISSTSAHFFAVCEYCDGPVALLVKADRPKSEYRSLRNVHCVDISVEECGWRVVDSWPKPQFRNGSAPQGLPEHIKVLLEHSHEAARKGGYDLAIMGYQRVVRMAQLTLSPGFQGSPLAWVSSMITGNQLTKDMASWARRVKLRSEIESATAVQAEELATFAQVLLEQTFGTRSRMARCRAAASA